MKSQRLYKKFFMRTDSNEINIVELVRIEFGECTKTVPRYEKMYQDENSKDSQIFYIPHGLIRLRHKRIQLRLYQSKKIGAI